MTKRLLLTVFAFFSWTCFAQAQVPAPEGWVNDFAGVISPEYQEKISSLIREVEQKTSTEITVVTSPSIAPYGAGDYAQMLFDNWKIGKKGKDNGVLILLAVKEREWRIHTGYGVEGILPDGVCGQIGRDYLVPYFKDGKYAEGLYYGAAAVANIIAKDANVTLDGLMGVSFQQEPQYIPSQYSPEFFDFVLISIFLLLGFIPIWFPIVFGGSGGGGYRSGGFGGGGFSGGGFGGGGFGGGGFGGGFSGGGGAGGRF